MMSRCECCGKTQADQFIYYRTIASINVSVCDECTGYIDKRGSNDPEVVQVFINWAEWMSSSDLPAKPIRQAMQWELQTARTRQEKLRKGQWGTQRPDPVEREASPGEIDGNHAFSANGGRKTVEFHENNWAEYCKIIGYLLIFAFTIAGGAIGSLFSRSDSSLAGCIIFGVFVGFFVGLSVMAVHMMIVRMCQDAAETRDYVRFLAEQLQQKDQ